MTDYLLILLADLLFASQFLMTKLYSARNPQSALTSFAFSFGSDAHTPSSVGAYLDKLEDHKLYSKALQQWENSN